MRAWLPTSVSSWSLGIKSSQAESCHAFQERCLPSGFFWKTFTSFCKCWVATLFLWLTIGLVQCYHKVHSNVHITSFLKDIRGSLPKSTPSLAPLFDPDVCRNQRLPLCRDKRPLFSSQGGSCPALSGANLTSKYIHTFQASLCSTTTPHDSAFCTTSS